jgi:hypothetical protein
MRITQTPRDSRTGSFEQRALTLRIEPRIETALEVQFRRVENLLRTMDALTSPRRNGR